MLWQAEISGTQGEKRGEGDGQAFSRDRYNVFTCI